MGEDAEVDVVNTIGAKEGDRVVIHLAAGSFLKATFLMYVFPILCLVGGAVLGERLALWNGWNPSHLSVALGFGCFAISVAVVKVKGGKMGEQDTYRPKIIRIEN
jgi:sigma-E factor negative regulatory protein RseC